VADNQGNPVVRDVFTRVLVAVAKACMTASEPRYMVDAMSVLAEIARRDRTEELLRQLSVWNEPAALAVQAVLEEFWRRTSSQSSTVLLGIGAINLMQLCLVQVRAQITSAAFRTAASGVFQHDPSRKQTQSN
jgi:hypothetical protein